MSRKWYVVGRPVAIQASAAASRPFETSTPISKNEAYSGRFARSAAMSRPPGAENAPYSVDTPSPSRGRSRTRSSNRAMAAQYHDWYALRPMLRFTLAVHLIALSAVAKPPTTEQAAQRLHERAREAYGKAEYVQAIELWREAEKLHPHWKYAYNLANVLYEERDFQDAWAALVRAEARDVPARFVGNVAELRAKITSKLLATHARLTLTVEPAGARVTIDGKPWPSGEIRWASGSQSRIEVRADGHLSVIQTWTHAPGGRLDRRIALKPAPTPPPIGVAYPGVALDVPGWITAGVGVATVAGGAVALALANSDAEEFNAPPATVTDRWDSHDDHVAAGEAIQRQQLVGVVLLGVGGAAVVAGVLMVVLDDDPAPAAALTPLVLPSGGGIGAVGRF